MNERRKEIARYYTESLRRVEQVETPPMDDKNHQSSWHLYWIKCEDRNELSVFLDKAGINTGVHYKPIHTYKCYGKQPYLPIAEKAFPRLLSLPMHPGLKNKEVEYVVEKIWEFYEERIF